MTEPVVERPKGRDVGAPRGRVPAAVLAAVTAGWLLAGVGAAQAAIPDTVGPGQQFVGMVNGGNVHVVVRMGCFGPVKPGQTGHPMEGQTLEVAKAEVIRTPGYTGSRATAIVARFREDPSPGVFFSHYGVAKPIPTSLVLPCAGGGVVRFTPQPGSPTAHAARVTVSYEGQP